MEDDIEKRMEVCDVCGSFLVVNDLQIRVDAHVMGKQHRGYATLRQKLRELRVRHASCLFSSSFWHVISSLKCKVLGVGWGPFRE